MTDADLRRAFEASTENAVFRDDCPPADRLWAGARGELPPDEVVLLTNHLASCEACTLAWRVAMDFGDTDRAASVTPMVPRRTPSMPVWLPIAASVMLVAGSLVAYRMTRSAPAPAVSQTQTPAPPSAPVFVLALEKADIRISARTGLVWRGTGDQRTFMNDLAEALVPYRDGQYAAAVDRLEGVARKYQDMAEPHFYLGVSRLLAGRAADAVSPLQRAQELAEDGLRDNAAWYLAVAYERAGQPQRAREQLHALCTGSGANKDRACAGEAAIATQGGK